MKYMTARKYLGEIVIWEHTDSTSQLKICIMGTLLRVEECTVAGNEVVELSIKGIDDIRYVWLASSVRIVQQKEKTIGKKIAEPLAEINKMKEDIEDTEEEEDE